MNTGREEPERAYVVLISSPIKAAPKDCWMSATAEPGIQDFKDPSPNTLDRRIRLIAVGEREPETVACALMWESHFMVVVAVKNLGPLVKITP